MTETASRSASAGIGLGAVSETRRRSEQDRAPILIALDGREHDADALALGLTLRRAFDGEVVLVHVMPVALPGRGMAEFERLERREGQDLLAKTAATVAEPVGTELISPSPAALALERTAFKKRARLIVLGSSHRTAVGQIVPGGVGIHLLKGAPCPVAVAPAGYARHPDDSLASVGVAYDATSASQQALLVAARAAKSLNAPLHVYHAVPCDDLDEPGRAQMIVFGEAILNRALEQLPAGTDTRLRLLSGDPSAALIEAVAADGIGLLFAGSRGHGPLRESLFGGVCGDLLRNSPCALVLIPRDLEPIARRL